MYDIIIELQCETSQYKVLSYGIWTGPQAALYILTLAAKVQCITLNTVVEITQPKKIALI